MEETEIFGVELDLLNSKFKEKMQETTEMVNSWGKQLETNSKVSLDLNTYNTEIKIMELKSTISNLKAEMKNVDVESNAWKEYALFIAEAEKELQQLKNSLKETNNETNKFSKVVNSNFKNAVNSTKKFALSLFSIRGMYSLVSKASSSYLQTNEALNKSTQITTSILGNTLAPVIKKVVDYSQYGAIVLAKVVQLFTGYNALANITTASLNKTSKASKNLSKNLSGLDEITNINSNSSGLSSDIQSSSDALKGFEEKVANVEEIFNKYEDEIKGATELLLIMFGANTLGKISNVIGSASAGIGLSGVASLLGTIGMGAAAVITVSYAVKSINELKTETKKVNQQFSDLNNNTKKQIQFEREFRDTLLDKIKAGDLDNDTLKTNISLIEDRMSSGDGTIKQLQKELDEMSTWERLTTKNYQRYREQLNLNIEANQEQIDTIYAVADALGWDEEKMKSAGITTEDLIDKMKNQIENLEGLNTTYNENTEEYQENIDKIKELKVQVNTLTKENLTNEIKKLEEKNKKLDSSSTEYQKNADKIKELKSQLDKLPSNEDVKVKVTAEADTAKASNDYGNFFSKLGESFSSIGQGFATSLTNKSILGGGFNVTSIFSNLKKSLSKIWSFDVGTNYVPHDALAMVHKGEQIVPAKWNPATSGMYGSNEETNDLLRELITTLEEKDNDIYLDGEKISQNTINRINSQKRIMGRSVV